VRRSLEILLLLFVVGLAARSYVPPRPLIRSFHLADHGCYGVPNSYCFNAEADGSVVKWRVVGKYYSDAASQRGEWTLDDWNQLARDLESHGLFQLQPHMEGTGHVQAFSVQADQNPNVQFTEDWPHNRAFVEFVPETEIYKIAQAVMDRAKQQHQSRWQSRHYWSATVPAGKLVGGFSGRYQDAEFKVQSPREFTARSDRKTLDEIQADLSYIESLPLLPPQEEP